MKEYHTRKKVPFQRKHFFLYEPMVKTPAITCLSKVNNRNTRKRCEICLTLTIETQKRRQWRRYGIFSVNFEHISHLFLVFDQVNVGTELVHCLTKHHCTSFRTAQDFIKCFKQSKQMSKICSSHFLLVEWLPFDPIFPIYAKRWFLTLVH